MSLLAMQADAAAIRARSRHLGYRPLGGSGNNAIPLTVRNVTYRSRQAAADALGVTLRQVYQAIARGTVDKLGLDGRAGSRKPREGRA